MLDQEGLGQRLLPITRGRLSMAERWHPQSVMHTPDDDQCFVAEDKRAFRRTREACFQLLKRLQREGPDPYVVVIPALRK
jgi:hypothetical protein